MANSTYGIGNGSNYYNTGALSGFILNNPQGGYDGYVIVANTRCQPLGFIVYNSSGSTRTMQVFDSETVPVNGTIPKHLLVVPSGGQASISFGAAEISQMKTGLAVCSSSTIPTLTLTGTPDLWLQVFWLNQGF